MYTYLPRFILGNTKGVGVKGVLAVCDQIQVKCSNEFNANMCICNSCAPNMYRRPFHQPLLHSLDSYWVPANGRRPARRAGRRHGRTARRRVRSPRARMAVCWRPSRPPRALCADGGGLDPRGGVTNVSKDFNICQNATMFPGGWRGQRTRRQASAPQAPLATAERHRPAGLHKRNGRCS